MVHRRLFKLWYALALITSGLTRKDSLFHRNPAVLDFPFQHLQRVIVFFFTYVSITEFIGQDLPAHGYKELGVKIGNALADVMPQGYLVQ